jgi:hypothetical protein
MAIVSNGKKYRMRHFPKSSGGGVETASSYPPSASQTKSGLAFMRSNRRPFEENCVWSRRIAEID